MPNFINLLGFECETESNETIEYDNKLVDLFDNTIGGGLIKIPIIKWYCKSDTDPLSGETVGNKKLYLKVFLNYYLAMMLLESTDDSTKLLFHKPHNDLYNLISLTNTIIQSNHNLSEKSVVKLDLENICHEYKDFNLMDILINDVFTGKQIHNPVLTKDGILVDKNTLSNIDCISEFINGTDSINISLLFNKIKSEIKDSRVDTNSIRKRNIKNMALSNDYSSLYNYSSLNFRCDDFHLNAKSTSEYMLDKYNELMTLLKNDCEQFYNFNKKRTLISELISRDTTLIGNPNYSSGMIEKYRKDIGFPVLSFFGTYSEDLSLLNLSNMYIGKNDNTQLNLKGTEFIGSDLTKTVFLDTQFNMCSFVAAIFKNTVFDNCSFNNCVFLGLLVANMILNPLQVLSHQMFNL
jgi:uncharacterized protein YjbI with pentapeptide repeats